MSRKSKYRNTIRNNREHKLSPNDIRKGHVGLMTLIIADEYNRNNGHEDFIKRTTAPDTNNLIYNRSEMEWIIDTMNGE